MDINRHLTAGQRKWRDMMAESSFDLYIFLCPGHPGAKRLQRDELLEILVHKALLERYSPSFKGPVFFRFLYRMEDLGGAVDSDVRFMVKTLKDLLPYYKKKVQISSPTGIDGEHITKDYDLNE